MGRYKKLGKNILLITIGNMASKLMSFFLIPLYTASLTTTEYGTADLMTTTVNLLMPFFTLLISEAVLRFSLDDKYNKSEVLTSIVPVFIIGGMLFFIASQFIWLNDDLSGYYWYFIIYYFSVVMQTILSSFVRGIGRISVYSLSGILHTLLFLLLNIFFLLVVKIGLQGYLFAMIAGNIVASIFLFFAGKVYTFVSPKMFDKKLLKEMLNYSVPMIPNSLGWWISNSSDKYMLTFFYGVSITGIYSVSQRIPSLFAMISSIFMSAWHISAVEDFGSESTKKFYSGVYRKYSVLNILVVSILIFLTKPIAFILFSKDFFNGWYYVPILLVAFLFNAQSAFLGSIYTSAKKTKMLFVSTVIAAIMNIVFNFLLIPLCGATGAAIATLISYFVVWMIRMIDSKRILVIGWNKTTDIISYILIIVQTIVIMLNVGTISVVASFIICLTLFVVNKNEIGSIFKKVFDSFKCKR